MLYGLDINRISCDSIFNLLCSYGNILKVVEAAQEHWLQACYIFTFLGKNPHQQARNCHGAHGQPSGCKECPPAFASDQADGEYPSIGVRNLEELVICNSYIFCCSFSKHDYIADKGQAECMPDGTPCWKDFTQSRNNRCLYCGVIYFINNVQFFLRFLTAEAVSKNRIIAPSKILHFYNAPPDSTEDTFKQLFVELKVPVFTSMKFFSQGQPGNFLLYVCTLKCRWVGII